MEKKIASLFFLRKDKQVKSDLLPIYLRVTMGGERFVWSTQKYVQSDKWSASASRVKGSSEEAKTLNAYLDLIKHKIFTYQKELMLEHKKLTIVSFKAKWLGNSDSNKFLLEVFDEHNRQMAKLIEKEEYAQGTLTHFETTFKHTRTFVKLKFRLTDIQINNVDYAFLSDFEFYLKSEVCAHNTTIKYLGDLKKTVLICVKRNWLEKDPFVGYDMSRRDVEREFLVDHELQMLSDKKFQSERLMLLKDIFLLSRFTGLAYADVKKLKRSEIRVGIDGKKWLFIQRQKTDTPSPVPLLPVALNMIEKYKEHPRSTNGDTVLYQPANKKFKVAN